MQGCTSHIIRPDLCIIYTTKGVGYMVHTDVTIFDAR